MNETLAPKRWPARSCLAFLLLAGAAIRAWQACESLWLDELHTAWAVGGGLSEVATRAAMGNQSPLFFWLEWMLVRSLGASEFTLRLPSLIAGSLLPGALYVAGRRWTNSEAVGLSAAWLAVVDPKSIFYATEARPYAMIQLLAVVHILVLVESISRPLSREWAWHLAWAALSGLLFYLHYTTALLLLAEALIAMAAWAWPKGIGLGNGRRAAMGPWLATWAAVAVLCLPAIPQLIAIFERRQNWEGFISPAPAWEIFTVLPWSLSGLVIAAGLAARALRGPQAGEPSERVPPLPATVTLAWLFVPVSLAWLATTIDVARLFFARYLIASAPAALLLAAMCLALVPRNAWRTVLAAALCGYALWSSQLLPQFRYDGRFIGDRREDWRGAVTWLDRQYPGAPLPVLVRSGLIEADGLREEGRNVPLADYCLLPVTGLYRLGVPREDLVPLPNRGVAQLSTGERSSINARGGAWLVVRGSGERLRNVLRQLAQIGLVPAENDRNLGLHPARSSFGNVHVVRLTTERK